MTNTNQMLQEAVDALQWHYDRGYPDQFTDGPRKRDARILRAIKAHLAAPGAAPSQQPAPERNEWQEAVLDQLTAHAIDAPKDEPPAAILRRIIDMAVTIALDPAVSSDAQALIDRGVAQQPARDVPSVDYPATIDALRAAVRNLEAQVAARPEFETRADDKLVRVDRWEWGIRRIVALLWGNRRTFEVDEVVQAVRELVPHPQVDDESLCQAVESWYGAAQPAHPDEFVCPHCFDEGAAPQAAQSGMVMVPWDPTDAMRRVGADTWHLHDGHLTRVIGDIYRAMIAAAPRAVPQPQPLTDEQFADVVADASLEADLAASPFKLLRFARAILKAQGITAKGEK